MIKAIIFDCFGVVLANTSREHMALFDRTDPEKAENLRAISRAADHGILSRQEALEQTGEILGITAAELLRREDEGEVKNQPLLDFIETLRPQYRVAMLSNVSGRDRLDIRFDPNELNDRFDVVIASGDEGYIKPEQEIYEIAAARLGVAPQECVMIDDIELFCNGARATGMQAIQFLETQQAIADLGQLIDNTSKTD